MSGLQHLAQRISGYDPNSLRVETARELMREAMVAFTGAETLSLPDALNRVLASDVVSTLDVPAHDNAAMDGYALRGADLREDAASRLRLIGKALAGRPYAGKVGAGQCVR